MIVRVRDAGPADRAELEALAAVLAEELREQRGAAVHLAERRPIVEGHLRALAEPAGTTVLVAELDGVLVGAAAMRTTDLADGTRLGVIDAYGVLPDAREVGVGQALVDEVVARCRAAGCVGIDADALPGARQTKNFFETMGFTARRLVVHHRLDTAAPADGGPADEP